MGFKLLNVVTVCFVIGIVADLSAGWLTGYACTTIYVGQSAGRSASCTAFGCTPASGQCDNGGGTYTRKQRFEDEYKTCVVLSGHKCNQDGVAKCAHTHFYNQATCPDGGALCTVTINANTCT